MLIQLKKEYFSTFTSFFIEVVLLVLLPVVVFLYFPFLLPYRTVYIVLCLGYIILFFHKTQLPIFSNLGVTRENLKRSVLVALALTVLSWLALIIILNFFPNIKDFGGMIDDLNKMPLHSFALVYILISIPLQELIFRGFFVTRVKLITKSKFLTILLPSLVSTFIHGAFGELFILPFAFVFGVLITTLFIKYGNIIGPILYHAATGLIAMLLVL